MRSLSCGLAAASFVTVIAACATSSRGADALPAIVAINVRPPKREIAPPSPPQPIEFTTWRGTSFGTYLAPKSNFVTNDGGVDLIFHFHAGQMAEKEWRASCANAVVVSAAYGIGSGAYEAAFANPARFGEMMSEVLRSLKANGAPNVTHVRRVSLLAWSAGYGAIARILAVPKWYAMIDTVVLLDGLHAGYIDPVDANVPRAIAPEHVDLKMIAQFVRFASDAVAGKKEMFLSHSSIMPPDYASTTETMDALLAAIDVARTPVTPSEDARGMILIERADAGDLHMRGFAGESAKDHIRHLRLVEDAIRDYAVPRWQREISD